MREIKFRVWDIKNKKFIYEYDACHRRLAISFNGKVYHGGYDDVLPASDYIIQQYTDLKDKNGKEIYEGDIVKFNEPTKLAEGVYIASLYVFDFYEGSFTRPYIYNSINGSKFVRMEAGALNPVGRAKLDDNQHFDWTKAEVLGNILSNPELIDR